jgi:hypothetical protein
LKPSDPSEWLPFMFAHANASDYEAAKVEISFVKGEPFFRSRVCNYLDQNPDSPLTANPEAREFILTELCTG